MKVRRHLVTLALFLGILAGSAIAFGDFSLRPLARWFADDQTVGFGNTAATPDASCGWETTGAEDHLACVIPTGAGLLVSSDANVDRSGVIAPGATFVGACSDDAAAPTECVAMRHNGTDGFIDVVSGDLRLSPTATGIVRAVSTGNVSVFLESTLATARLTQVQSDTTSGNRMRLSSDTSLDQVLLTLAAAAGRHVAVTDEANALLDHGYAAEADPALYVQSSADPTAGAGVGASVKLQYVAADDAGYVGTPAGGGPLRLNPATASVRLPQVVEVGAPLPAEPHTCAAQANAGAMVYVDDSNDSAAATLCVCIATGDDGAGVPNAWDWVRVDNTAAACPFF